jgi:hypothetical protein
LDLAPFGREVRFRGRIHEDEDRKPEGPKAKRGHASNICRAWAAGYG